MLNDPNTETKNVSVCVRCTKEIEAEKVLCPGCYKIVYGKEERRGFK